MSELALERISVAELEAESGAVLPTKEVLSVPLLDLTADINLALDLAAPIDLAIAGNANVVLPINASVSANALSLLSSAQAGGEQAVGIDQFISGHAVAHGDQTSGIDQTGAAAAAGTGATAGGLAPPVDHATGTGAALAPVEDASQPGAVTSPHVVTPATPPNADATPQTADAATAQPAAADAAPASAPAADPAAAAAQPTDTAQPADTAQPTDAAQPVDATQPAAAVTTPDVTTPSLDGGLLNVDVKVDLNSKLAAPITGAVALNANVAAPINGSVSANVGSVGSDAIAVANQTAIISQQMQDVTAEAVTHQDATIDQ